MSIPVKLGAAMPLHLQLGTGAAGRFVRATLRDAAGAVIGSPATLVDRGLGLYSTAAVFMSAATVAYATYEVFLDAGFTVPSTFDQDGTDVFLLDTTPDPNSSVDLQLLEVSFGNTTIVGDVDKDDIDAQLVESPAIEGEVAGGQTATGDLDNQTIEGEVDAC